MIEGFKSAEAGRNSSATRRRKEMGQGVKPALPHCSHSLWKGLAGVATPVSAAS